MADSLQIRRELEVLEADAKVKRAQLELVKAHNTGIGKFNQNDSFEQVPKSKKLRREVEVANQQNTYREICSEIVPLISDIIDSKGGVCALGEVVKNSQSIQDLLKRIPQGYSNKIQNILKDYHEYVVVLEGGFLATAKGYDIGAVTADGKVDIKAAKQHKDPKPTRQELIKRGKQLVQQIQDPNADEEEVEGLFREIMVYRTKVAQVEQNKEIARNAQMQGGGNAVAEFQRLAIKRIRDMTAKSGADHVFLAQFIDCAEMREAQKLTGQKLMKLLNESNAIQVIQDEGNCGKIQLTLTSHGGHSAAKRVKKE